MSINIPSKKTIDDTKPKFALLPDDHYKCVIKEIKEEVQNKFGTIDEQEDVVKVRLEIISLKNGDKAFDDDGKPAEKRLLFFDVRPDSIGFMQDGTPSKTRQLIAYSTDQDIFEELQLESWHSLEGKTIIADVVQYMNKKNVKANKVAKLLPNRKSFEEVIKGPQEIEIQQPTQLEDGEIDPKSIPF